MFKTLKTMNKKAEKLADDYLKVAERASVEENKLKEQATELYKKAESKAKEATIAFTVSQKLKNFFEL